MSLSKETHDTNKWIYHYDDIMKKWDNNDITEEEIRELIKKDLIDPLSIHQLIHDGPLADDLLFFTCQAGTIKELQQKISNIKRKAYARRKYNIFTE